MSTRLPRYQRAAHHPELTIGKSEHQMLCALGRFGYLAARQILRLLFSAGSKTYVQEKLQQLYQARYVERVPLMPLDARGSSLPVYCLDNMGFNYLRAYGLVEGRFRAAEQKERQALFLRHTLGANDLLILTQLLARQEPRIELVDSKTELELRRTREDRQQAVPDGWIDLTLDGEDQVCIAFELDRNTATRRNFSQKVRNLVNWAGPSYLEAFGTMSLTIAVVAAAGSERRVKELLIWSEDELTQMRATQQQTDLFRFADFDPASADPRDVFLRPIWQRPFDSRRISLLELDPVNEER